MSVRQTPKQPAHKFTNEQIQLINEMVKNNQKRWDKLK